MRVAISPRNKQFTMAGINVGILCIQVVMLYIIYRTLNNQTTPNLSSQSAETPPIEPKSHAASVKSKAKVLPNPPALPQSESEGKGTQRRETLTSMFVLRAEETDDIFVFWGERRLGNLSKVDSGCVKERPCWAHFVNQNYPWQKGEAFIHWRKTTDPSKPHNLSLTLRYMDNCFFTGPNGKGCTNGLTMNIPPFERVLNSFDNGGSFKTTPCRGKSKSSKCSSWETLHRRGKCRKPESAREILENFPSRGKGMDTCSRYIASLTTIPDRIKGVRAVLERLLHQSVISMFTAIVVNVPKYSEREGKEYIIPETLTTLPEKVVINRMEVDYGPTSKLIGGLQWLKSQGFSENTCIVVLDDDHSYHPNLFQYLRDWHLKLPDDVVASQGWTQAYPLSQYGNQAGYAAEATRSTRPIPVQVVQGNFGYMTQSRFYNETIWTRLESAPPGAWIHDDNWISGFSASAGAKRWVVPQEYDMAPDSILIPTSKGLSIAGISYDKGPRIKEDKKRAKAGFDFWTDAGRQILVMFKDYFENFNDKISEYKREADDRSHRC